MVSRLAIILAVGLFAATAAKADQGITDTEILLGRSNR